MQFGWKIVFPVPSLQGKQQSRDCSAPPPWRPECLSSIGGCLNLLSTSHMFLGICDVFFVVLKALAKSLYFIFLSSGSFWKVGSTVIILSSWPFLELLGIRQVIQRHTTLTCQSVASSEPSNLSVECEPPGVFPSTISRNHPRGTVLSGPPVPLRSIAMYLYSHLAPMSKLYTRG